MDRELLKKFTEAKRGVIIAAAGCGKTQLIAEAVKQGREGKDLVLTHTHAGVWALQQRLRHLQIPSSKVHVETIAGWALKYAISYPSLSGLQIGNPADHLFDWSAVHKAATRCLRTKSVRRVICSTYKAVYVDEYQDCVESQHGLVRMLAEVLPCKIVGDPLQGIFDFGKKEQLVNWQSQVFKDFELLGELNIPWRWKGKNEALGRWLLQVREKIINGSKINLDEARVWLQLSESNQRQACYGFIGRGDSVIAIGKVPQVCYSTAKKMQNHYACVESLECPDLFHKAEEFAKKVGPCLAVAVLDFAVMCMTQVGPKLKTLRNCFATDRMPGKAVAKRYPQIKGCLMRVAERGLPADILDALNALGQFPGRTIYRKELWGEMKKALRINASDRCVDLSETVGKIRDIGRRHGRRLSLRTVATTLLIKGLEFDHAVILDADSLDAKNLYVALTRGSKSLTVLSANPTIRHEPAK